MGAAGRGRRPVLEELDVGLVEEVGRRQLGGAALGPPQLAVRDFAQPLVHLAEELLARRGVAEPGRRDERVEVVRDGIRGGNAGQLSAFCPDFPNTQWGDTTAYGSPPSHRIARAYSARRVLAASAEALAQPYVYVANFERREHVGIQHRGHRRPDAASPPHTGVGSNPSKIAITANGAFAYVTATAATSSARTPSPPPRGPGLSIPGQAFFATGAGPRGVAVTPEREVPVRREPDRPQRLRIHHRHRRSPDGGRRFAFPRGLQCPRDRHHAERCLRLRHEQRCVERVGLRDQRPPRAP